MGPTLRISPQKVRIPTQRVLTVLWMHHWQRYMSTKLQNIPAYMKQQLSLHKSQRIPLWDSTHEPIRAVAHVALVYLLLLDIGPSNALD